MVSTEYKVVDMHGNAYVGLMTQGLLTGRIRSCQHLHSTWLLHRSQADPCADSTFQPCRAYLMQRSINLLNPCLPIKPEKLLLMPVPI